MVSKPLASNLPSDSLTPRSLIALDLCRRKAYDYGHYAVVQAIINRLWDDADLARRLANLHAGLALPSRSSTTATTFESSRPRALDPRSPACDIDFRRIISTVELNSFETPPLRTSNTQLQKKREETDELQSNRSIAIYELPSFFNHSCIANAHRRFFGDVIVIRAGCAIKAGEEVTIAYYDEKSNHSGPNGIQSERVWGFSCSCKLCIAKKIDGPIVVQKCRTLAEHAVTAEKLTLEHATSTVAQLETIYSQPHWKDVPCKENLSGVYVAMAAPARLSKRSEHAQAQASKEWFIKALESEGVYVSLALDKDSVSGQLTKNQSIVTIDMKAEPSDYERHVIGALSVSVICCVLVIVLLFYSSLFCT